MSVIEVIDADENEEERLRFSELDDDVQADLLFNQQGWWQDRSDELTDYFKDLLCERGFTDDVKVEWGLSYCQGDGVAFTVREFEVSKISDEDWVRGVLALMGGNRERGVLNGIGEVSWPAPVVRMTVTVENASTHYAHWNSMSYDVRAITCVNDPNPAGFCDHDELAWDWQEDDYARCECDALLDAEHLADEHPLFVAVKEYFQALSRKFEKIGYEFLEDYADAAYLFRGKRFDSRGNVTFEFDDPDDDEDDD